LARERSTALKIAVGVGLLALAVCSGWLATGLLDGPWGMLPGGPLAGPSAACETARWDEFAATRELELEVHPPSPRSLTTWSVVQEGELFVPADFLTPWKRWPHQVLADDRVRLRLGGQVFECRAERVADAAEIERLRRAIAAKYELHPEGREATIEVWWFRIGPR
jgi:hypothetical protein